MSYIYITGAFNSNQIIVVIHLTALLEYLCDCSIRVYNHDNPPMYNNHGMKKPPCNKSSAQVKLMAFLQEDTARFVLKTKSKIGHGHAQ